jgi:hypothetical protein
MRIYTFLLGIIFLSPSIAQEPDAAQLIREAMEHWRGLTSYSDMTMTIHRPDWER